MNKVNVISSLAKNIYLYHP